MNRNYELVVILDPDVVAKEQEELLSKIKKIISDSEGQVIAVKDWGKKEFTYPISKRKAGLYHVINFSLPASTTLSLKQKLSSEEGILRYLLIVDEGKEFLGRKKEKNSK